MSFFPVFTVELDDKVQIHEVYTAEVFDPILTFDIPNVIECNIIDPIITVEVVNGS